MKQLPDTPTVDDAPEGLLESGHCWLLERVAGAPLRFQVRDSGLICFGDRTRVYDDPEEVPAAYRHAVRHVRDHLDRDALREAVANVTDVVFFGVATVNRGIDYDWERTPAFLGVDVWSADGGGETADGHGESGDAGAFRPPDAVEAIYERLGLHPVNALEREVHVRDFDPDSYAIPDSAWYDGPAAGVLIRNKRGDRAVVGEGPGREEVEQEPPSPAELAERFGTSRRFERLAGELADSGQAVTADALAERAVEEAAREAGPGLVGEGGAVDSAAVRGEIAALARTFLDDRPGDAW